MDILKNSIIRKETDKVTKLNDLQHARARAAMYMGGMLPAECHLFRSIPLDNGVIILKHDKELFSQACSKVIDEILSNGIDQWSTNGLSNISLSFDKKIGECVVKNDGSCVPLTMSQDEHGVEVPTPELSFGHFKSSSNFNKDEKDSNNKNRGGQNGLGASLTNAFCSKFKIDIFDAFQGIKYVQTWSNCMSNMEPPIITQLTPKEYPKKNRVDSNSYTEITFTLNWEDFGVNFKRDTAIINSLERWIQFRMMQTSIYVNSKVCYNGKHLTEFNNIGSMIKALTQYYLLESSKLNNVSYSDYNTTSSFTIIPNKDIIKKIDNGLDYNPWDVSIGVKPNDDAWGFESISIINGLWVMEGGVHVEYIMDIVCDYIKPLMSKLYGGKRNITKAHIKPYIVLGICCQIPSPDFDGQRKDKLSKPGKAYYQPYSIPDTILKKIWISMKVFIQAQIDIRIVEEEIAGSIEVETDVISSTKGIPKYYQAEGAHKAKRGNNQLTRGLIIAEGDSANGIIEKSLRDSKIPDVSFKNHGTFNIQGVPMNARKYIDHKYITTSDVPIIIRKQKLKDNERFSSLVKVLGLNYGKQYTVDDIPTLNYQYIVIATDQDEHGKGLIKTTILDFFSIFWESLVKIGFVKFLITPAIRCYYRAGKKETEEFYSEKEYEEWENKLVSSGLSISQIKSKWKIDYYKGLGSHDPDERRRIFENYSKNVMTFVVDKHGMSNLKAFLGDNSAPRKKAMSTPVKKSEQEYYTAENTVTISQHIWTDTKSFQLYDISTRIPNEIDGLTVTKRKTLETVRNLFGDNAHDRTKVLVIMGAVMDQMEYHHGDVALSNVILKQAQDFVGAKLFPYLKGMCDTGSRHHGGNDKVEARYGYVKLNTMLTKYLYSHNDNWSLKYCTSEGKQVEPINFVPILPMAILENNKMPAHAYANTTWARDYNEVYQYIIKCIDAGVCNKYGTIHEDKNARFENTTFPEFKPDRSIIDPMGVNPLDDFAVSVHGYMQPKLEMVGDKDKVINSMGSYHWRNNDPSTNVIIITELPFKVWNSHFINGNPNSSKKLSDIKGIKDDVLVIDVMDRSDDKNILIEVQLVDNVKKILNDKYSKSKSKIELDHIIKYFDIKQSLKPNLVFLNSDGGVVEYSSYMEIFKNWYFTRQKCYYDRIMRQKILIDLKITRLNNIIRFIENRRTFKLEDITEEEQDELMKVNNFVLINNAVLNSPKSMTHVEISHHVLTVDSTYSYLLNMGAREFTNKKLNEYKNKLANFKTELNELDPPTDIFKGQTAWKKELIALHEVINTARTNPSKWTFDEPPKFPDSKKSRTKK
jgi:DNA topoisomerase-2